MKYLVNYFWAVLFSMEMKIGFLDNFKIEVESLRE